MHKLLILAVGLCCNTLSLAACPPSDPKQFSRSPLEYSTPETLLCDYSMENMGSQPPKIGLALAGGGTRAGYFAHGVLQGLNDSGLLDHIDVISSVSGGGYAAYWYFMRRMQAQKLGYDYHVVFADCLPDWWGAYDKGRNGELLRQAIKNAIDNDGVTPCGKNNAAHYGRPNDPYVWQAHLARWPDIFQMYPNNLTGNRQKSPTLQVGKDIISSLLRKGFSGNDSVLRYENGIDRAWGLEPLPRQPEKIDADGDDNPKAWVYENADPSSVMGDFRFRTNSDATWAAWLNWRAQAVRDGQSAPNWVLNGRVDNKTEACCPECVYEIGAYAHGSIKTGYRLESFPTERLSTSVRASAAFSDTQGLVEGSLTHWGARVADKITNQVHWGVNVQTPDNQQRRISDGGGEENTGVLSLVRRGVSNIIMVDAGLDKEGNMEDLCRLKGLLAQSKMSLEINGLDRLDEACSSGGKQGYNTSAWLNPVMEGRIWGNPKLPEIRLWYIKLGWDEQRIRRAFSTGKCGSKTEEFGVSCMLAVYWGQNGGNTIPPKKGGDGYMLFPQLSTTGVTYNASTYLFWAYRELGRFSASRLKFANDPLFSVEALPVLLPCKQSKLELRVNKRPFSRPSSTELPNCEPI